MKLQGLMATHDKLEEEMESLICTETLKIGASSTIGTCLLPKWISAFSKLSDSVQVHSKLLPTEEIEKRLLNGSLDLALIEGSVDSKEFFIEEFLDDELIIICNSNHPLNSQKHLDISSLNNEFFLLPCANSSARKLFNDSTLSANLSIKISGEYNNDYAIINGVRNGLGLGIISRTSDLLDKDIMI